MVLGMMVEEKVYCKYMGEQSQRQTHLGKCRVDKTRLNCARRGEEERKGMRGRGTRCSNWETQTDKEGG